MKRIILISVLLLSLGLQSYSGWVITQKTYDSDVDPATVDPEVMFLSNNRMKIIQGDLITIFDLNVELITIINTTENKYWSGKVSDFKTDLKATMKAAMDEQLKNMPEDQRKQMEQMYAAMLENMGSPNQMMDGGPQEYKVDVVQTKHEDKIAGYEAKKYEVKVNGNVKEIAWLAREFGMRNEFDIEKFYNVFKDFVAQNMTETSYQFEDEYLEMAKRGFPMKTKIFYSGYHTITEVIQMEEKSLSDSDFLPPSGSVKASISDLGIDRGEE